jgi:hypothetical protein
MAGRPVEQTSLEGLPADAAAEVRDASTRIKVRMHRTAQDIVEIGRDLILIKEKVGHGNFLPWIDAEFGMSQPTALNFMRVAEQFGEKIVSVTNLTPTVLYALAAPSTPEEVRDNVIEMAQRGEKVTTKTVAELKDKLKAAQDALKTEKETRAAIEGRSREVMKERDQARSELLLLRSANEQLQLRLKEAGSQPAEPEILAPEPARASEPKDDELEPELIPPTVVDVNLQALLALWHQSGIATRQAFLAEIEED